MGLHLLNCVARLPLNPGGDEPALQEQMLGIVFVSSVFSSMRPDVMSSLDMRIQSRQTTFRQQVQKKCGNSRQRRIADDKSFRSTFARSTLDRRLFAFEPLEDRRLLAGTTPDVYELKSLSPTYDSSYFIESPRPVLATVGTDGTLAYDFRSDMPGDQTVDFISGVDWSKQRFLVDPNQSYRLGFINTIGEGGIGFEAFDEAGNRLGVYSLPYRTEPDNYVRDIGNDVAILGPSGRAFPAGTFSFHFTNNTTLTGGAATGIPGGITSFAFGFLTDKIHWVDSKVSVDRWHANDWVKVDTNSAYPISYYATLQNSLGQLHSLGYEASDADRLLIEGIHVQRYGNAADTRLTSPLNPGDTVIQVQSTAGWAADSLDPRNRSLAWYGYTDDQGTTYSDYTYTRNVARDSINGLWNPGGIVGNTITLPVPWSGPALAVGTAIRNAVDSDSLIPALQFQSPLRSLKAVTVSGLWQQGTPTASAFPPGTQFIRLAASTNLNSLSVDENVAIRMKIGQDVPPQVAIPNANRRSAVLDVMANDEFASQITSVTQPVYGSIQIVAGADGRTRLRYQSSDFQIGSDYFSYTVQLVDGSSATEQGFIKLLGGNLDSNPTLQASIAHELEAELYPIGSIAAVMNQELIVDQLRSPGLVNAIGPAYLFVDKVTTTNGASRIMPDGSYRFTPKPNSTEAYFFSYDVRSGANQRFRSFNNQKVYANEFLRDQERLKQIGLNVHNFESTYQRVFYNSALPLDANGRPFLSWRVLMLPMLTGIATMELYNKFKLDEPWNSANNLPLLDQMPDVFRSASDGLNTSLTRYQVIADSTYPGTGRFFLNNVNAAGNRTRLNQVTDGTSNTLLVVQTGADKAVPWTKPDELPFDANDPLATLGNVGNYFNAVFADGQVRALPTDIGAAKFSALSQINDGVYLDPATETRKAKLRADFPGDPIVYGEAYQANQIKKLALAFHNYESAYKRLPPAGVNLSWRVSLLPYLEQYTLYNQFRFDEPWNSATNLALLDDMPDIFRALGDSPDTTDSSYRLLGGTQMAYASGLTTQGPRFSQFTDGVTNSILFVEAGKDLSVPWTKPDVLVLPSTDIWANLGTLPEGQMRVAMADGAVRSIWNGVSNDVILGLATTNGGDSGWPSYQLAIGDPRIGSRWHLSNQLKQIGLAVHNYESARKFLPNDFIRDVSILPTGSIGLSWRVAILPYIEQEVLYNQFRLNESWDSPHNLSLLPLMPDVFKTGHDLPGSYSTRIQRFSGPGTLDPRQRLRFSSVTDGLNNTFLVAVTDPEKAVPWTKPDDIDYLGGEGWSSLGRDVQLIATAIGDGSVAWFKRQDDYFEQVSGFSFDNMVLRNDGRVGPVPVTRQVILREGQAVEALWVAQTVGLFLDFDDPSLASVANAIQAGPGLNYQRITLSANSDRNGSRQTKLNVRVLSDPNNINSPLRLVESIDVIVVDSESNLQPTINQVSTITIDEDAGLTTIPLTGITAGGSEAQPLRMTVTSNSSLTGPLTVNYVSPSNTGEISFTTGAEQFGNATITVTVEDGGPDLYFGTIADNQTRQMTFQLIVREVNDAPLINAVPNVSVDEDAAQQTTSFSGIAAGGGETQPLKITASSSNTTLIANPLVTYTSPNAMGQLRWTPLANRFGQSVITLTVEDGGFDKNLSTTQDNAIHQQFFTVSVNPVNDRPLLDSVANATVLEGAGQQSTNLTGILAGGGESQPLRVSASSNNPTLIANPEIIFASPNSTGRLNWTPIARQAGQAIITVVVEDAGLDGDLSTDVDNARAQRQFTITVNPAVNDPPVLNPTSDLMVDEDSEAQVTQITGIAAGDDETQPLRVIAKSSNPLLISDPVVVYSSPNTSADLIWLPIANSFGQTVITVTVEDGGLDQDLSTIADNGTAQRLFTITVNPVNDLPQIQDVPDKSVDEDAIQQTTFLTGINAGGSGVGIEAQPLKITSISSNPGLIPHPQVNYSSGSSTGQLTWKPTANLYGESVITVIVEDGGLDQDLNTVDDNARIQKSFTVTVNPVNDAPSFEAPSNRLVQAGSPLQMTDVTLIRAGAFEQQPLILTVSSDNPQLIADPTVVYSSPEDRSQFFWQPVSGQAGIANITVTLSDGLESTSRVFTIAVNAAPTPLRDRSETVGTKAISINVLGNDSDRETIASQLQVSIVQPPDPSQGLVSIDAKRVSFQAAVGFFGMTSFVYRVTDSDGGTAEAIAEVGVARSAKQNPWNNLDVNRDTRITPSDALQVINLLNDPSKSRLVESLDSPYDLDVNGDNRVSPADALKIINELNLRSGGEGESNALAVSNMAVDVVDYLVADFETHLRPTLQRVRRMR